MINFIPRFILAHSISHWKLEIQATGSQLVLVLCNSQFPIGSWKFQAIGYQLVLLTIDMLLNDSFYINTLFSYHNSVTSILLLFCNLHHHDKLAYCLLNFYLFLSIVLNFIRKSI